MSPSFKIKIKGEAKEVSITLLLISDLADGASEFYRYKNPIQIQVIRKIVYLVLIKDTRFIKFFKACASSRVLLTDYLSKMLFTVQSYDFDSRGLNKDQIILKLKELIGEGQNGC